MNRIVRTFESLKKEGENALVGFVTAGDPNVPSSMAILEVMCQRGVDILELGVPFSDPTADGLVIQHSSARALKAGVNLDTVFYMTRELRRIAEIPIVLFSYYNPILAYGLDRFYENAVSSGADGLLVVDLPPEESDEMTSLWPDNQLAIIRLITPITPRERITMIVRDASGFLYLVSMTGVTGSSGLNLEEVAQSTHRVKSITRLPVCVGYGISTPEQVASLCAIADGVVVGSAFERIIETHLDDPTLPQKVGELVQALKGPTRLSWKRMKR